MKNKIKKDPTLAGILSFFIPGLGQIYCGKQGIGILFMIGYVIGLFCMVIPGIILWIASIYHAINLAKRINNE